MRIAVIGFGFSGLMVTAQLVRQASEPLELYLIAPDHAGLGVAYSTGEVKHLLNVRAGNMGAWAENIGDFARWLASDEGKYETAKRKLTPLDEHRFAPRALYGDYLVNIWHATQDMALGKNFNLKLIPATATHVTRDDPLAVLTDRGDAIAVDKVVLATGNEIKPILTQLEYPLILQNPWKLNPAKVGKGPVVLMGTGLTAIDTIIALREGGYKGEIITLSRNGLFPQPHKEKLGSYTFDKETLLAQHSLVQLMCLVRRTVKKHTSDWREVVDALRPHTQLLWQKLNLADQRKFLARLNTIWNTHRHRMAPEIAAMLERERASGKLTELVSKRLAAHQEGKLAKLEVVGKRGETRAITASCVINCTGPELNPLKSTHGVLPGLLRDGLVEPHPTGIGFAADPHYRLFGEAYPNLYAVGSLMTGQFLESTAVPELRVQAQEVAKHILKTKEIVKT